MSRQRYLTFLVTALVPLLAAGEDVRDTDLGEAVERHLADYPVPGTWALDPELLEAEAGDRLEVREVMAEGLETVKLKGVVPPIRFESGVADIPDSSIDTLREELNGMRHLQNVRLHMVGHADDQPLSGRLADIYGDNAGLSRERAGEVAEFVQTALSLPPEAISFEWAGDTQPVATNATADGRALNRRVEVEIWYDEIRNTMALQEVVVPEEIKRIKVCRMETVCKLRYQAGHARRARVKNLIAPLHYEDERLGVDEPFLEQIRQALVNLGDKENVTVKFIGFTDDRPLTGRNARIYGNHLSLSKARAHRVALEVAEQLSLPTTAIASDGHGADQPLASNESARGRATNRRIEVEFWHDDPLQELPDEPQLCPDAAGARMITKTYDPPWGRIPPLELEAGEAIVPAGYTELLKRAMADVSGKSRPRLRFVGYTGNERLDRRTAMVYGDDIGLSAARARRAMERISESMALAPGQVEHEGRGYVHSGDVVNAGFTQGDESFVAVEVVYDDLALLDDYEGVDVTPITRELTASNPLGLNLMRITVDGEPIDDPGRSSSDIQRCTDVALERTDIQFRFDNLQAERRLSVSAEPGTLALSDADLNPLPQEGEQAENDPEPAGAGPEALIAEAEGDNAGNGQADDNDNAGMSGEAEVDDEASELDEIEQVLAMETALDAVVEEDARPAGPAMNFRMYSNYAYFIDRAEVRIFDRRESVQADPLAVVEIDEDGFAEWHPAVGDFSGPVRELKYVLRAYGDKGHFDETEAQPLWIVRAETAQDAADTEENLTGRSLTADSVPGAAPAGDVPATAMQAADAGGAAMAAARGPAADDAGLLSGYGESALSVSNIPLSSGTVTVLGSSIPEGHTVHVAGLPVPADTEGNFVSEVILPSGSHTVEVAVLDEEGNGELFLRDIEFESDDWFYMGIADVTLSANDTSGPADELQGADAPYDPDSSADGRLAFYVNGKFREDWKLTASADTREESISDLFSNFMDRSPESLFRRMDPDYYYPTFGDDGTVEQTAPTMGKFYVRVDNDDSRALWGNFQVDYADNELARIDRGLYGGNVRLESEDTTSFGDERFAVDGFAAEPGTLPNREEFRGTGGSLYFLGRQDVLPGSERVRIEVRDKDTGIVNGVVDLRPGADYDIDYLQGRIMLSEPLAATVDDDLLVRTSGISGDEAWLVAHYEHTPGFESIDTLTAGAQGHYWLGDSVRLGLTVNNNDEGDTNNSSLGAADLTLRKSAESWIKFQAAQSDGLVSTTTRSDDGGFEFGPSPGLTVADEDANAYRTDLSVGFGDLFPGGRGRMNFYLQSLDAGYSAQGLNTATDTEQFGATLNIPLGERFQVATTADVSDQDDALKTTSGEINLGYQVSDQISVSTGLRHDDREDRSSLVPVTQEEGERTDAVVQVAYDSRARWKGYGFLQGTLSADDGRDDNDRVGAGGSFRFNERLVLDGEVSGGELGTAARVGTNYIVSERTSTYLNYTVDSERTEMGEHGRRGNLVSGLRTRFSDSTSVYVEERYEHSRSVTGLTHATGVSLAPFERWNFAANSDIGTLRDRETGAETKRRAGGLNVGYGFETVQLTSGVEYRYDDSQQVDGTWADRTTWLFKNSFKYQTTPDWRLVGKFNHADSDSELGSFYDGGYTEAVLGYAFRPVNHDRLNALAKYTYFYNVPGADQLSGQEGAVSSEFIQKSHIAAVDVDYDLTSAWSVGGKYAYRLGQVSLDREDEEFFDNDAHLYIVRTDLRFRENWEGLAEVRMLDLTDLNDRRSGALVAVYRYLGEHFKAGIGYNFTDFSDDLTDLSYDQHGVFLNLIGAM
jgi:flagellar motor protein MotB